MLSCRHCDVDGQALANGACGGPVTDMRRMCKIVDQRAIGAQLRQPGRDGERDLVDRHVDRPPVQAITDAIDRRGWGCLSVHARYSEASGRRMGHVSKSDTPTSVGHFS